VHIQIVDRSFEPFEFLQAYQCAQTDPAANGANAIFVGRMRDHHQDTGVLQLQLEHYPGMTEKILAEILLQAEQRWPISDGVIIHRVGSIRPAEAIVLVVVWSAHRAEALKANQFVIEALKSRAPFWKKEIFAEGERWLANNTPEN
jgi:molybdopterin synthase catalytic subunit